MIKKGKKNEQSTYVATALEADIPHINFNGFTNTLTAGDSLIVLTHQGKPVATINASYTVMKTLAIKLSSMIELLEEKLDTTIFTVDQIAEAMAKAKDSDG